ncbi:hypothetical protein CCP3SC1AL1_850012 [Gammaproteobacteria bacterium]
MNITYHLSTEESEFANCVSIKDCGDIVQFFYTSEETDEEVYLGFTQKKNFILLAKSTLSLLLNN